MAALRTGSLGRAIAIATLPLLAGACTPGAARPTPNILIVLADDWSFSDYRATANDDNVWNDLPTIDRLAHRGQSWQHFYSQPVCASARITLMFGRYHGETVAGSCAKPGPHTPPAGTPSLASVLRSAGYSTGAFGKWHVASHPDPERGWAQAPAAYGFDVWRAMSPSNIGGHCRSKDYLDWYRVDDGVGARSREYHTEAVAQAARAWWNATSGPKLAYVGFQAPHQPLHAPPAEYLPEGYPTPETQRAKYEAMLVALDGALGRLLEGVDLSNTVVFVLGDNGTPSTAALPGVQDARRMKATTYEDGVHVPFIVAGAGVTPATSGGPAASLGHVVDLLATCAELAGAAWPAGGDSISLVPTLRDPSAVARAYLICDYVAPQRGEASNTRAALEERGIQIDRHRDTAVVLREPGEGALFKRRWVQNLETGVLKQERFLLSDPGTESTEVTFPEPIEAQLDELFADYLREHPSPADSGS